MTKSHWKYKGKILDEIPQDKDGTDAFGFVYKITHKSGLYYIGLKLFTKAGTKQVKGKKKKVRKESDWKTYASSSEAVKQMIVDDGKEAFDYEILHFVRSKSEASYVELKEQLSHDVMFDEMSLNGIINVRINKKHLQKFKTPFAS